MHQVRAILYQKKIGWSQHQVDGFLVCLDYAIVFWEFRPQDFRYPIPSMYLVTSMYGIFTCIWLILWLNVGKYARHMGWYCYGCSNVIRGSKRPASEPLTANPSVFQVLPSVTRKWMSICHRRVFVVFFLGCFFLSVLCSYWIEHVFAIWFFPGWWFQVFFSMFTPYFGKMDQLFDSYMSKRGWFNHQRVSMFFLNFQDISKEKMFSPQAASSKKHHRFSPHRCLTHHFSLGFID